MNGVDAVFAFSNGYASSINTSTAIKFITIGLLQAGGEVYGAYYESEATRPFVLIDESRQFYAEQTWFSRG